MRDLQVCFQGGGAKLALLMGAASAMKEAEGRNKIRVTRVSGSSAGAICAALYAFGVDFKDVRNAIRTSKSRLRKHAKKNIPTNLIFRLPNLVRGHPLIEADALRNGIQILLETAGIAANATVADAEIPLLITISDVASKTVHFAPDDQALVDALFYSASIPFIFKTPKSIGDSRLIDGGFIENLPASELLEKGDEFGEAIAVSFKSRDSTSEYKSPRSITGYLSDVWDAVMGQRTEMVKELVFPSNVLELNGSISASDFNGFFGNEGLGEGYNSAAGETREWLDGLLSSRRPSIQAGIKNAAELAGARQRMAIIQNQASELWRNMLESTKHERISKLDFMVQIPNLERSIDYVTIVGELRNAGGDAIYGTRMYFIGNSSDHYRAEMMVERKNSKGEFEELPFMLLPLNPEKDEEKEAMLVIYGRPQMPGDTYRFTYKEEVPGFMSDLRDGRADTLSAAGNPNLNSLEDASITLITPENFLPFRVEDDFQRDIGNLNSTKTERVPAEFVPAGSRGVRRVLAGAKPARGIALKFIPT